MGEMTLEQAKQGHKELWEWLAQTGCEEKDYWPGWKEQGGEHPECENDCFACEYAKQKSGKLHSGVKSGFCTKCPIVWAKGMLDAEYDDIGCHGCSIDASVRAEYDRWCDFDGDEPDVVAARKEIAAQIRDIAWKE